jgi:formiminoglutamase
LLGHFDFGDIQYLIDTTARTQDEKIEAYRHAVNTVDDEVEQLAKMIAEQKRYRL